MLWKLGLDVQYVLHRSSEETSEHTTKELGIDGSEGDYRFLFDDRWRKFYIEEETTDA